MSMQRGGRGGNRRIQDDIIHSPVSRQASGLHPTYVIYYGGGVYYAKSFDPAYSDYSSADLATAIQACLDAGTGIHIYLKLIGTHILNAGLTMTGGNKRLGGIWQGSTAARSTTLTLANSVNAHMITIDGNDYYDIDNLTLLGNKGNQVGNWSGVYCVNSPLHVTLSNLQVYSCGHSGFELNANAMSLAFNCFATLCGRGFTVMSWNYRSSLEHVTGASNNINFFFGACDQLEVFDLKSYRSVVYSGVFVEGCSNSRFFGVKVEESMQHGVYMHGSNRISMIGGSIINNSQEATNTYDGIYFASNGAVHCLSNNVSHVDVYSTLANVHRYSVRENDANQNYNLIFGSTTGGAGTAEISLQGVNSVSLQNR